MGRLDDHCMTAFDDVVHMLMSSGARTIHVVGNTVTLAVRALRPSCHRRDGAARP